jgi:hypothetical protein
MRHEQLRSLADVNHALQSKMATFNSTPFQKKELSRAQWFEQERKQLNALPATAFEVLKTRLGKVSNDCSVMLGEDKHYYTVPHKYVATQVEIQYNATLIQIYSKATLIATHLRDRQPYRTTYVLEHYPEAHRKYADYCEQDTHYYLQQAANIGPHTRAFMQNVISAYPHELMAYKACQGILRLAQSHSKEHIDQHCAILKQYTTCTYAMFKKALDNKVALAGLGGSNAPSAMPVARPPAQHQNTRGAQHFQ